MVVISISEEILDQALGTVSAQKIFRLLTTWGTLSLKDLQIKGDISESQLHLIIQRLIKVKILYKEARGVYSLNSSPFVDRLAVAYMEQIKESINLKIYQIQNFLDEKQDEKADQLFQKLETLYNPVLTKYFSHQMSGLTHQVLERYEFGTET